MSDKRSKGCPNIICEQHKKKVKYKADNDFCPKCGTRLIYVCAKCFKEIEDIDEKHRICRSCDADVLEKKEKVKDGVLKAGKAAASLAGTVAVGVAANLKKDGTKAVIKAGTKFVETAAKTVLKK